MATFRTSAAGGSTSGTGNRTVAITPAVGDLLVVYCFVSTNTNDSPTCTDNNGGGTYTLIDTANVVISAVNHRLSVFVRDALMVNTTATTITVATGSNTSGCVHVLAYSGMTRTGADAVRSKGLQNNQAAGTAAPALNQAALPANPTIVAQGSADTTTTPPGLWSEAQDTNFATPTVALETAYRNSGHTGTTITFGAASSTTFCSHALELDTSTPISQIDGTASLAFGSGSSTLIGSGVLAGTAALLLSVTATGAATSPITGTATLTLTANGTPFHRITQLYPFGYSGQRYGDFNKPPGRIAGSAALTFGGSATADQIMPIAGTAALQFGARGLVPQFLTQLQPNMWPGRRYGDFAKSSLSQIDGTAALEFGGSAFLIGQAQLFGSTDLEFDSTGTAVGAGALVGTTTITFGAAGLLDLPSGEILGTAVLTLGGSGTLRGTGVLAGSTPLILSGTASAQAVGSLAGTSSIVLTASGLLNLPLGEIVGTAALAFTATATLYNVDLLDELGAYYRLDENLEDSSGADQDLSGAVTYAAGKLNQGLTNGEGTRDPWTQFTDRPLSIAFWVKPESGVGVRVRLDSTSSDKLFILTGTIGEIIRSTSSGPVQIGNLTLGVFSHVVYTLGSLGEETLYINGAVAHTGTFSDLLSFTHLDLESFTPAVLDEVGLWGRALNPAEIEDLYNDGDGFDPTPGNIPVIVTGTWSDFAVTGTWADFTATGTWGD